MSIEVEEDIRLLSPGSARGGLHLLAAKARRVAEMADGLSATVRMQQRMVEAVLEALAPDGLAAVHDAAASVAVSVTIELPGRDFCAVDALVDQLQARDPDCSIDECLKRIFNAGVASLAGDLIATHD